MADEEQLPSQSSGLVVLRVYCPLHWDPEIVLGRLRDFVMTVNMPGWAFPDCFEINLEHEQCQTLEVQ